MISKCIRASLLRTFFSSHGIEIKIIKLLKLDLQMKNKCERNKSYYFAIQRLSKLKKRYIKIRFFNFILHRTDSTKMCEVFPPTKPNNRIAYHVLEYDILITEKNFNRTICFPSTVVREEECPAFMKTQKSKIK